VITASVREIIGTGKIWDLVLLGQNYNPVLIAILSPGAFITLGLLIGLFNLLEKKKG
jgi:electron transport complex protein RnfE